MDSFEVFPSLPVPDMTTARGAGPSCVESQTRSLRSNQNTSGTGRAQGMAMLISSSGTLLGSGAMFSGGVPNTVARSPPESARPVAGSGAAGDGAADAPAGTSGSVSWAITPVDSIVASIAVIAHFPIKVVPSLPASGDAPPQGLLYR